jgi:hypothetical protein
MEIQGRNTLPRFVTLFCAVLLAASVFAAPPDKKGKGGPPGQDSVRGQVSVDAAIDGQGKVSGYVSAGISFGDARQLATRHGMTGASALPPGIRKNLARGKPLPPGIAKNRMSGAFVGQLPAHPGYEWRQAGTDLVLVVSGTWVVSDVLENVFD